MGKVDLIASQFYRFYFCRQLLRILYRFRNIGKEGFHLLLRFKIEFIVRETETFPAASADRRRDRLIVVDTEKRSEEHTSELQSRGHLVCRLLLEKKNSQRA